MHACVRLRSQRLGTSTMVWLNLVWDRRSIALLDLLTEEVFDETKHTEKISFQQQSACYNFFSHRWSPSKGCLLHQRFFGSSSIICQKANFPLENDCSPNLIFLEDLPAVLYPHMYLKKIVLLSRIFSFCLIGRERSRKGEKSFRAR